MCALLICALIILFLYFYKLIFELKYQHYRVYQRVDLSNLYLINEYQQLLDNNNKQKDGVEEYKNKTEARQLIEQTKKMMEEYSLNKIKKNNNNKNNKTMSNFNFDSNFNDNNIYDDNNKSAILSKDRLDQLAGKPNSIDSLTQKLIIKNKEIKNLERELKEKTNQLKMSQDKLAAKNEEIKKMLEILDNERSNSLKVENAKLNNLNNELINYQNRNKDLENKNLLLRNDNEKLRKMLNEKTNLNLTLKEKNEIEKKK